MVDLRKGDRHKRGSDGKLLRKDRRKGDRHKSRKCSNPPKPPIFVAFDGEGKGREPHVYTMLTVVHQDGTILAEIKNEDGIPTYDALELLTSVRHGGEYVKRIFGFATGYDLSMILKDLSDRDLYKVPRSKPKTGRPNHVRVDGPKARYLLSMVGKELIITRSPFNPLTGDYSAAKSARRTVRLSDTFKFFACKAVKAYEDWGVYRDPKYWHSAAMISDRLGLEVEDTSCEQTILAFMRRMKDSRSDFDACPSDLVSLYNVIETQGYADLAEKIWTAVTDLGLTLRDWHGAGSIAKAILNELNIRDHMADESSYPPALQHAILCAFAGGRFEISRAGPIPGPVWEADIASAYPYQLYFLPCMRCGSWRHVQGKGALNDALHGGQLAVARVSWKEPPASGWGSLMFRREDGSTIWPLESKGGAWCWRQELQAAVLAGTDVRCHEAWIYSTPCDHRPFGRIADLYRQRVAWGKDGRGIVLKLGLNALYGVTAQSVGSKRYRSLVWAGNVTSGTRAMLARAIRIVGGDKVLMLATDALYTTVEPFLHPPYDTGTDNLKDSSGAPKAALGAWEKRLFPDGLFIMRPGVYFDPAGEKLRSRGFGASTLRRVYQRIVEQWREHGPDMPFTIIETRFTGMKSGVYRTAEGPKRRDAFGQWREHEMTISYDPRPKRCLMMPDRSIVPWPCPPDSKAMSAPYSKGLSDQTPDGRALRRRRQIADDQPDAFAEISEGD